MRLRRGPQRCELTTIKSLTSPYKGRGAFLRRTAGSSRLVRLLDNWIPLDAEPSRQEVAERLGQWLGVHDVVTLHAAQQSIVSGPVAEPVAVATAAELTEELRRLRASLQGLISADEPYAQPDPDAGFAPHHRRYLGQQRRMQGGIDGLRVRIRQALSVASPRLAQLAMLDGVMQQLFGAREQKLLSTVPLFLKERFEQLHRQQPDALGLVPLPLAWLDTFRRDLQEALLAELDTRLQPLLGMLSALNSDAKSQS